MALINKTNNNRIYKCLPILTASKVFTNAKYFKQEKVTWLYSVEIFQILENIKLTPINL